MTEEHIRTLTVRGVSYTYREMRRPAPTTEPVVLMGGILEGMYDWTYLEDVVLPRTSLITVDMPGLDPAAFQSPDQSSIDKLSEGLAAILADTGHARVNLYGYSLGAAVAFHYAQRHPGQVARLLIGGVPVELTKEIVAHLGHAIGKAKAGDTAGFADHMAAGLLCLDESHHVHRRALSLGYVRRSLRALARDPQNVNLLETALTEHRSLSGGLVGVPTLVFTGEHDHLHTLERQRAFAETIDGSRFATFPDCDHMMPLQRPEAISSLVTSFLMNDGVVQNADYYEYSNSQSG